MAPTNVSKITRALKERGPARRSDLYKWLRAHHTKLRPLLDGPERSWLAAAELIAAEGLVGATGKPASPKALRQMWLRVSRDVERVREQAAAAAAAKPLKPWRSRPRNDWQPPVTAIPAGQAKPTDDWLPRSSTKPTTPASSSDEDRRDGAKDEASKRLADLRRTIAERSGH